MSHEHFSVADQLKERRMEDRSLPPIEHCVLDHMTLDHRGQSSSRVFIADPQRAICVLLLLPNLNETGYGTLSHPHALKKGKLKKCDVLCLKQMEKRKKILV